MKRKFKQNKQSSLILTVLTKHKKDYNTHKICHPGPSLGQAQKCGGC
jgi:hypothetical protein